MNADKRSIQAPHRARDHVHPETALFTVHAAGMPGIAQDAAAGDRPTRQRIGLDADGSGEQGATRVTLTASFRRISQTPPRRPARSASHQRVDMAAGGA